MDGSVGIEMEVLLNTDTLSEPPHVSAFEPAQIMEHVELSESIAPPFAKLLPQ